LSLGLLLASAGGAENAAPLAESEAGAATVDAIVRGMAGEKGVEARFSEKIEMALLSMPLENRGRLYFIPPRRMARFTSEPAETALIVDGEALRFREGEEEVDLSSSPMARHFVDNLVVLWSGDVEELRRRYRVSLSTSGPDGEVWALLLEPRRAPLNRFIESIRLTGAGRKIDEMSLLQKDGDRTTTRFEEVVVDRSFSEAELQRLFGEGRALIAHSEAP